MIKNYFYLWEKMVKLQFVIKYIIIDKCKKFNLGLLNYNEIIRIIDEEIELSSLSNINDTERLYLQKCNIKNSGELCN